MKKLYILTTILSLFSISCYCQSQAEMNETASKEYSKADAILNATYKLVLKKMKDSPHEKELLIEAQRAWLVYVKAHCKSVASAYEGGSMEGMIYSQCLTEMTKERTKKLNEYLKDDK